MVNNNGKNYVDSMSRFPSTTFPSHATQKPIFLDLVFDRKDQETFAHEIPGVDCGRFNFQYHLPQQRRCSNSFAPCCAFTGAASANFGRVEADEANGSRGCHGGTV
jgi:hypothetical protein